VPGSSPQCVLFMLVVCLMFDDVGAEVAGRDEIFAKRRHLSEEARPPHCLKDFHVTGSLTTQIPIKSSLRMRSTS
jgi:hypothetical protein